MKTEGRKVGAKCVGEMFNGEQLPRYYHNQFTGRVEMLSKCYSNADIEQMDKVEPKKTL